MAVCMQMLWNDLCLASIVQITYTQLSIIDLIRLQSLLQEYITLHANLHAGVGFSLHRVAHAQLYCDVTPAS